MTAMSTIHMTWSLKHINKKGTFSNTVRIGKENGNLSVIANRGQSREKSCHVVQQVIPLI